MNASHTARERVRAELIREITEIARRQLATEGAAGLSLRAVAKEMGMVSSAVYRYFPNKEELLTTLIIDGYNAVGAAVEKAEAACPTEDYAGRWLAACRAVRDWALAHPHEYALVYGSPVPGYRAPERTIGPASRSAVVFGKIIGDAYRAGAAELPGPPVPVPASFTPDAARLRDAIMEGVPGHIAAASLIAWSGLFGLVSFELFGQFENVVTDRAAFFDHAAACLGRLTGVPA
ncbi:MAG TPA: TetR/AcrR family transcriptional regulator [Streptosporangiaceae bacterium]|nr:TetR/AcrR family transcriptional regulator [Streptosporangiaceae bacterium]